MEMHCLLTKRRCVVVVFCCLIILCLTSHTASAPPPEGAGTDTSKDVNADKLSKPVAAPGNDGKHLRTAGDRLPKSENVPLVGVSEVVKPAGNTPLSSGEESTKKQKEASSGDVKHEKAADAVKENKDQEAVKKEEKKEEKKETEKAKDESQKADDTEKPKQNNEGGEKKKEERGDIDTDDDEDLEGQEPNGNAKTNDDENEDVGEEKKKTKNDDDDDKGNSKPYSKSLAPRSETAESSGSFMTYFIPCVVVVIALYIAFHNRHKILAYLVEGRRAKSTGRRRGASGTSGPEYRQLNNSTTAEDQL